jgi:hypothetical protein
MPIAQRGKFDVLVANGKYAVPKSKICRFFGVLHHLLVVFYIETPFFSQSA